MKKFCNTSIFLLLFLLFKTNLFGQFSLDAQMRNRTEFRHGYKTLFPDDTDPAFFNAQRTRINAQFESSGLKMYISLQDVRTWGDVAQLNVTDKNGLSLHQTYAEVKLNENIFAKAGRQEIVYDNARFMGNVDWTSQGRSHDALLLKFSKNKTKLDFGLAYNQNDENLMNNTYTISGTYKTFQYVWLHQDYSKAGISLLLLNNGMQYIDTSNTSNNETRFSQTTGMHLTYNTSNLLVSSSLYYQFGKDINNNKLNSYLFSLDLNQTFKDNLNIIAGIELISGNKYGVITNNENKAFNPIFGTNHKFNGNMDYFFVGNHFNSVGLTDLNLSFIYKISPKHILTGMGHHFLAGENINNTFDDKTLGTEIDLAYKYKFSDIGDITLGYSQMFAQNGLKILKNNYDNNLNQWAFVMLTLNPQLYNSSK
jgi:hypothetical protein